MPDANDLLMSGGIPAARFPTIGSMVTGTLVREPESREQTDLNSGAVLRWDNGEPKMQVIVHLQTDERNPEDITDDGVRALYIKGQMLQAIRQAVRAAGADGVHTGGTLTVTFASEAEPSKRGFNPAKQYTATYVPPSRGDAANAVLTKEPTTNGGPAPAGQAPAGVDPQVWAGMDATQRAAVLSAHNSIR